MLEVRRSRRGIPIVLVLGFLTAGVGQASAGDNVWTSLGPEGGPIQALAVSPTAGTVFAGTQGAGVFRSTDGAATWARVNEELPPTRASPTCR